MQWVAGVKQPVLFIASLLIDKAAGSECDGDIAKLFRYFS